MERLPALSALLLALCLAGTSLADDVVILRDGRRLIGKVTRTPGKVTIKMRLGSATFDEREVLRIEPHVDAKSVFADRLGKLAAGDHRGRLELARWALGQRLTKQGLELARALAAGPESGPGAVGEVVRQGARELLVGHAVDGYLQAREVDKAAATEVAEQLLPYPQASRAVILERYRSRGDQLARAVGEGLDLADCAEVYRDVRRRLWVTVGSPSYRQTTSASTRERAVELYHQLLQLYLAEDGKPFLRLKHRASLQRLARLESLAEALQVEGLSSPGLERALDAGGAFDRAAFDRTVGLKRQLPAVAAHNDRATGIDKAERRMIDLINRYRDMLALPALKLEPRLSEAAEGHTRTMRARGFFSHRSPIPGRRIPADRVAATGYPWSLVGEVLARDSEDPEAVFLAFIGSPSHHGAIVIRRFRDIGINKQADVWTVKMAVKR